MSNNKYKILIVEDDHNIISFIQTILEASGYQVLTAERCKQGLLMLSSHVPDLVVLDLGLPDMEQKNGTRSPPWIWGPMTISSSPSAQQSCWPVSARRSGPSGVIIPPPAPAACLPRVIWSLIMTAVR